MRRLTKQMLLLLCFTCCGQWLFAQQDTIPLNSDELFKQARTLAFDGKRDEARVMLKLALIQSPNYLEIKTFMARTYAWDTKRDTALILLEEVLIADPKNKDASYAKLDVLYWDGRSVEAIDFADKQLKFYATDEQLLIKKAKALIDVQLPDEAALILEEVIRLNPNNNEAITLLESIKESQRKNSIAVSYSIDHFAKIFGNAHYQFVQYSHRTKYGSLIGRVNTSQRFDTTGIQPEIDFYPTLGKGFYGYLNYGISGTALYPKHRFGVELYKNLPYRLEASFGLRYLYFDQASTVNIYTATIGWYVGNWWVSARTFITPNTEAKSFSRSLTLLGRRYFSSAQNFIGVIANIGFSPNASLQSGVGLTGESGTSVYFLKSHRFGFEAQKRIGKRFLLGAQTTWSDLELTFSQGEFVNIWSGQIIVSYQF